MNILAVADKPSAHLERALRERAAEPFDVVLSCGDLDRDYLDRLATLTGRIVHWVNGNHDWIPSRPDKGDVFSLTEPPVPEEAFGVNLHGRVCETAGVILCGFAGARSLVSKPGHATEAEMHAVCRRVWRRLRWLRWRDRWLGRAPKPVIVVSHAPPGGMHGPPDPAPTGFTAFHRLIEQATPVLWLHGHVHLDGFYRIQQTRIKETWVLNVFEYKRIVLADGRIEAGYRLDAKANPGRDMDPGGKPGGPTI